MSKIYNSIANGKLNDSGTLFKIKLKPFLESFQTWKSVAPLKSDLHERWVEVVYSSQLIEKIGMGNFFLIGLFLLKKEEILKRALYFFYFLSFAL